MSNSDWQEPVFTLGDFDPSQNSPRQQSKVWYRNRRAEAERFAAGGDTVPAQTVVFIQPEGEFVARVQSQRDPSIEMLVPVNGGTDGFFPGQRVTKIQQRDGDIILGNPPSGEVGKELLPVEGEETVADLLEIQGSNPGTIEAGQQSQVYQVVGQSFSQSPLDIVTAVQYDPSQSAWVLDADVTIDSVAWVSEFELTVTISVTPSISTNNRFIYLFIERA